MNDSEAAVSVTVFHRMLMSCVVDNELRRQILSLELQCKSQLSHLILTWTILNLPHASIIQGSATDV